MPNYTGCQCTVCQNAFKPEDDIVVCPDCGTPYHRSCYAAKGECINTALHERGQSWQDVHRSKLEDRECPNCHHINAPDISHCTICGAALRNGAEQTAENPYYRNQRIDIILPDGRTMAIDPNDPCCGFSPDEELGGERLEDLASYVETNTLYYIPLFKRFKDTGKKLSLNLPCLFFPHLYFANRKMWLMTFITIVLLAICGIPSMLSNMYTILTSEEQIEMYREYGMEITEVFAGLLTFLEANTKTLNLLGIFAYVLNLAIRLHMSVYANWLYFRHAVKKVKKLRLMKIPPQTRRAMLRSEGGTNFFNMIGAIALFYGVSFLVMLVVLFPFYGV